MARTYKVKATPKQISALNNILSGEFRSYAEAMRKAGYSRNSSFNPGYILASRKGVKQCLETLSKAAKKRWGVSLPLKMMMVCLDGLEATKLYGREGIECPDWLARKAFADQFADFLGWNTKPR